MSKAFVILCTCPDEDTASRLGAGLVAERLAACVNVVPGIRSIYRWQGAVKEETEALMVIKTMRDRFRALEAWLTEHHPYEVPEVVALSVEDAAAPYLTWLEDSAGA
jgi:periplasmic divalent cation tolerance protein